MGSTQGTPSGRQIAPGEKRTIVIVGGSFAGRNIIEQLVAIDPKLVQLEVIWIDKLSYFEHIAANYESFVDKEEYDRNVADMSDYVSHFGLSNISFVQGMLKDIKPAENKVVITQPDSSEKEISYNTLVIATGAYKSGAWRPEDDAAPAKEDRKKIWLEEYEKVKEAQSILCVGGGVTGVELAPLIKEVYPEKRVAIAQRGPKLLPQTHGVHERVAPMLQKIGVEILANTPFSDDSPLKTQFDLVLTCLPGSVQGPKKYMTGELASAVEPRTGQVMVNKYFQVTNVHPIASAKPASPQTWQNIFSFGDCCLTPINELKQIASIMQLAQFITKNIYEATMGSANLQEMPEQIHKMQLIPIGKKAGLMVFNKMITEQAGAYQMKCEMRTNQIQMVKGDPKAKEFVLKSRKQAGSFFGMANGCCYCLPMHISKIREENRKELEAARSRFDQSA